MSLNERSTAAALGGVITQKPFRHSDWLEIQKPLNDLHCANLFCDKPQGRVAMSDYLSSGGAVQEHEFVVVHQWLNTHCIQIVRVSSKDFQLDTSFLLEDLGRSKRADEKIARLENWRALAVLSGAVLSTPMGGRPNEGVIAKLQADAKMIEDAISLCDHWPYIFRITSGRVADILIKHAGLKIEPNGNVCPADGHPDLRLVSPFNPRPPAIEQGPAQAELIGLPQVEGPPIAASSEISEVSRPIANAAQGGAQETENSNDNKEGKKENAMEQPHQLHPTEHTQNPSSSTATSATGSGMGHVQTGVGDRLDQPYDDMMRSGLYPPNFTSQGHHLRAGNKWAVVMHIPSASYGTQGTECLICTISDSNKYAQENSCVLRTVTEKEGLVIATPEVRMWKAVAACFGMYAVANQTLAPEPLTHPRTQKLIKRFADKIMAAIDLWPIAAHESLKPIAKARAQAVLQGLVPMKLIAGTNTSANDDDDNADDAGDILGDESANQATVVSAASAPQKLAGDYMDSMATPGTPAPLRQRTARVTSRAPARDSIDTILARARQTNEAVVCALKAEVQAMEMKIVAKAQLVAKLSAELSEEADKVSQLKVNLARYQHMLEDSPGDAGAAI